VIVTSEEEFDENLDDAHDHEEDDEHSDDTQHKAAHDNTFVLEASKCKACKCDYEKE
jgi:hypothetical protein